MPLVISPGVDSSLARGFPPWCTSLGQLQPGAYAWQMILQLPLCTALGVLCGNACAGMKPSYSCSGRMSGVHWQWLPAGQTWQRYHMPVR